MLQAPNSSRCKPSCTRYFSRRCSPSMLVLVHSRCDVVGRRGRLDSGQGGAARLAQNGCGRDRVGLVAGESLGRLRPLSLYGNQSKIWYSEFQPPGILFYLSSSRSASDQELATAWWPSLCVWFLKFDSIFTVYWLLFSLWNKLWKRAVWLRD